MRYQNLLADHDDHDYLNFTNKEYEGNISLVSTDELIGITNDIRMKNGNTDLVGKCNNAVYYNFYLVFDTQKQDAHIQAVCNCSEKDDWVSYKLPMSEEEKLSVMWQFIQMLTKEIYNS